MSARTRMDCEEAVRVLADFLDQELDEDTTAEVEHHLETCRSCFSRAEFERRLKLRLREEMKAEAVPAELEVRVRRFLDSLPDAS